MLSATQKNELKEMFGEEVAFDVSLSQYTSIHVGGPADAIVWPANVEQIQKIILWAKEKKIPSFILGKGSNTLIRDKGFHSRLKLLWDDFIKVLSKADLGVVLPVYAAGEKPIAGITGQNFFMELQKKHPKFPVTYAESLAEVSAALKPWVSEKTMILFLGAGDITKMGRDFVKRD